MIRTRSFLTILACIFTVALRADTLTVQLSELNSAFQQLGYSLVGKPGFDLINAYESAFGKRLGENDTTLASFQEGYAKLEKSYKTLEQETRQVTDDVLQKRRALTGVREVVIPQKYPGYDDDKKAIEQFASMLTGIKDGDAISQGFIERFKNAVNALNRKNGIVDIFAKILEKLKEIQHQHAAFTIATGSHNAPAAIDAKNALKEAFTEYDAIAGGFKELYAKVADVNTKLQNFIAQVQNLEAQRLIINSLADIAPRLLLETEYESAEKNLESLLTGIRTIKLSDQEAQVARLQELRKKIFSNPRFALKEIGDAENKGLKTTITKGLRELIRANEKELSWLARLAETGEVEDIIERSRREAEEKAKKEESGTWD